jgi:hypothetical protein
VVLVEVVVGAEVVDVVLVEVVDVVELEVVELDVEDDPPQPAARI